jgi:hypothetical protein
MASFSDLMGLAASDVAALARAADDLFAQGVRSNDGKPDNVALIVLQLK